MSALLSQPLLLLFAIVTVGSCIGQLSVAGVSLGPAGALFVALIAGYFGLQVPREIMNLGLVLFAYAIGLQAGPRFFRAFRATGVQLTLASLVTVTVGALSTATLARIFGLPADLACGLFAGALTSTPSFAAAIEAFSRVGPDHGASVSVGYGIAYPFALVSIVLLVQTLGRLGRREALAEEARWSAELARAHPNLEQRSFVVTRARCDGKSLAELDPHRLNKANITRLRRGEQVFLMSSGFPLRVGDVVMATGHEEDLRKLGALLGEETAIPMDLNRDLVRVTADVTNDKLASRSLADLHVRHHYGVVISSLRRNRAEIAPHGSTRLELGDSLVVSGGRASVKQFLDLVNPGGGSPHTTMTSFLLGLTLGIGLGAIPLRVRSLTLKLDSAGGVFVTSLLLGHYGHIGPFRFFAPLSATNLAREFGVLLFLAGAGTLAGTRFVSVLQTDGPMLLIIGALITALAVASTLLVTRRFCGMRVRTLSGALAACMTNSAALAGTGTQTDLPMIAFASIYPVALIFKVITVQVLAGVLQRWL